MKPPRLWRLLLAVLLPGRLRPFVIDDLDEEFRARSVAGRAARRWYRQQILAGLWSALRLRYRAMAVALAGSDRRILRRLRRSPAFTSFTILTMAIGFAATITIFALVDGILLRPLPFPDADRLVVIKHAMPVFEVLDALQSTGTYFHYRDNATSFSDMGIFHAATVNLTGDGEARQVSLIMATASVFTTLGASPLHGRLFTAADMTPDADPVVVLGNELWRERYGSDPRIIGRSVLINDRAREVVGVLRPDFDLAGAEGMMWMSDGDIQRDEATFADLYYGNVARLRGGVSPAAAAAELNALAPSLGDAYRDVSPEVLAASGFRARVESLREETVGEIDETLWLLAAAVALVLLIASANVAHLFLARAEYQRRAVAVRRALGAGGAQLFFHFLGESLVLCLLAGLLGLGLGAAGVRFLVVAGPVNLPRLGGVALDGRAVAFAAVLVLAGGLAFALISVIRHRGSAPVAIREGLPGATTTPAAQRAGRLLVAAQTAMAVALLIAALLLVQSFARLRAIDPGFVTDGVLALDFALPFAGYADYQRSAGFFKALQERVLALPEVEVAGAVESLPLAPPQFPPTAVALQTEGRAIFADELPPVGRLQFFLPGYFDTLRIALVAGTVPGIDTEDAAVNPIVINESLARQLFGGEPPIGKRLRQFAADEFGPWWTVIGVAGDVQYDDITAAPPPVIYLPVRERPVHPLLSPRAMTFVARGAGPATALLPAIRAIVRDLDPDMPIANVRGADAVLAAATAPARFAMMLLVTAATAAVFLGAVGVYGVASYAVGCRTREIGVRMAIGASAADIRGMVLRQGADAVALGLLAGLLGSWWLSRFAAGLLYGVSAFDPVSFAAAPLALLLIALLATLLPARRAARVDPVQALGGGLI